MTRQNLKMRAPKPRTKIPHTHSHTHTYSHTYKTEGRPGRPAPDDEAEFENEGAETAYQKFHTSNVDGNNTRSQDQRGSLSRYPLLDEAGLLANGSPAQPNSHVSIHISPLERRSQQVVLDHRVSKNLGIVMEVCMCVWMDVYVQSVLLFNIYIYIYIYMHCACVNICGCVRT